MQKKIDYQIAAMQKAIKQANAPKGINAAKKRLDNLKAMKEASTRARLWYEFLAK